MSVSARAVTPLLAFGARAGAVRSFVFAPPQTCFRFATIVANFSYSASLTV